MKTIQNTISRHPIKGWIKGKEYGEDVWYNPKSFTFEAVNIIDCLDKLQFDENGNMIDNTEFKGYVFDEDGNLID